MISYKYNFLTEGIVEKEHHLALKEEARRERLISQQVQKDNEVLRQRVAHLEWVEKANRELL